MMTQATSPKELLNAILTKGLDSLQKIQEQRLYNKEEQELLKTFTQIYQMIAKQGEQKSEKETIEDETKDLAFTVSDYKQFFIKEKADE